MNIRPARRSEAAELTRLAHLSKAHWGYPQEWLDLWHDDLLVHEETIDQEVVLVAEDDLGQISAYGILTHTDHRFEIDALFVDPQALGRGLGRALLFRLLEVAEQRGAHVVEVLSDPNAEDFYVKYGFVRVGEVASRPEGRRLPRMERRTDR